MKAKGCSSGFLPDSRHRNAGISCSLQTKTAPCHLHPSCHHFSHHHGSDHYQLFRSHYDDNVQETWAEAKGVAFKILVQFIAGLKTELGLEDLKEHL